MPASKGMYLAYFFQALIAINIAYALFKGQYGEAFTGVLVFALTFVPYVVADRLDVRFPWFVYFLIALSSGSTSPATSRGGTSRSTRSTTR